MKICRVIYQISSRKEGAKKGMNEGTKEGTKGATNNERGEI